MKKLTSLVLLFLALVSPVQAATVYGVNYDKQYVDVPPTKVAPNVAGGRVGHCYDSYTFTADLAALDVIKLCKLPAGARVIDLVLAWDDLDGSGGNINVGWSASSDAVESADDDGFLKDVPVTSPGTSSLSVVGFQNGLGGQNPPGLGKEFASPVDVQVQIEGDTDVTSGGLKLNVIYAY